MADPQFLPAPQVSVVKDEGVKDKLGAVFRSKGPLNYHALRLEPLLKDQGWKYDPNLSRSCYLPPTLQLPPTL